MIKEVELMKPGIYRCVFDKKRVIKYESIINLIDKLLRQYWTFKDFFYYLRRHRNEFVYDHFELIQNIRIQVIHCLIEQFLNRNVKMQNMINLSKSVVEIYINKTSLVRPLFSDRNYYYNEYLDQIEKRYGKNYNSYIPHNLIYSVFIPGAILALYFSSAELKLNNLFTCKVCALDVVQDNKKHFRLLNKGVFSFDNKKNQGLFKTLDFLNLNKHMLDSILEYNFYLDESTVNKTSYNLFRAAIIDHGAINL